MLVPAQMQQKVVLKTSLDPICSQKVQVIAVGQAQQLAIFVSRTRKKPSCSHCNCRWTCPSSLVERRLETEFVVKKSYVLKIKFWPKHCKKKINKLWQEVCLKEK